MQILDQGHKYELATLDGGLPQTLTFVKRHDEENPQKYPGNENSYPGTTMQNVIRALLNRFRYVNKQHGCLENIIAIQCLRFTLWLLEFRAARRHRKLLLKSFSFVEFKPMCIKCGHTFCKHSFN